MTTHFEHEDPSFKADMHPPCSLVRDLNATTTAAAQDDSPLFQPSANGVDVLCLRVGSPQSQALLVASNEFHANGSVVPGGGGLSLTTLNGVTWGSQVTANPNATWLPDHGASAAEVGEVAYVFGGVRGGASTNELLRIGYSGMRAAQPMMMRIHAITPSSCRQYIH